MGRDDWCFYKYCMGSHAWAMDIAHIIIQLAFKEVLNEIIIGGDQNIQLNDAMECSRCDKRPM